MSNKDVIDSLAENSVHVVGGKISVDMLQIKDMRNNLRSYHQELCELENLLRSQYNRLWIAYSWKISMLSVSMANTPSPSISERIRRLESKWRKYEDSHYGAITGMHSPRALQDLGVGVREKLLIAQGYYLKTEQLLLSNAKAQMMAVHVINNLISMERFLPIMPKRFQIAGQWYDTTKMDAATKNSLAMAYIFAAIGREENGQKTYVKVTTDNFEKEIPVNTILNSAELNAAWGKMTQDVIEKTGLKSEEIHNEKGEKITLEEFIKKQEKKSFKANVDLSKQAYILAGITLHGLFCSQDKTEKAALKKWESSPTAKALGGNAKRLEPKELLLNPHGTKEIKTKDFGENTNEQRHLPLKLSEKLQYSDTIDPKDDGAIEIIKLENKQGKKSWMVMLRGTQRWDGGSSQTQDMLTNFEEMAGIKSSQRIGIMAAMEHAGISPEEPVQIYGHSQGGILAANLAADQQMQNKYNIVSVQDAGSPTDRIELPENIEHTSLRNSFDLVWKLDDAGIKAKANHVTVVADMQENETGGGGAVNMKDVFGAHDRKEYANMAKLLEDSQIPRYRYQEEIIFEKMKIKEGLKTATTQRYEIGRR